MKYIDRLRRAAQFTWTGSTSRIMIEKTVELLEEIVKYHQEIATGKFSPDYEEQRAGGARDASRGFLKWLEEKMEAGE